MKVKILLAIVGMVSFCTLGLYSVQAIVADRAVSQRDSGKLASMQEECNRLEEKSKELMKELDSSGKADLLNNVTIAENFNAIEGGQISNIVAMKLDDGNYVEVVSTTEVEDVGFFTDAIDAIEYSFTISDSDTFLAGLKSTMFLSEHIDINLSGKTATVLVIASARLYRGDVSVRGEEAIAPDYTLDGELKSANNDLGVYKTDEGSE